jgi:glucokinase
LRLPTIENSSVLVYDVGGSHISAAVCFREGYRLGAIVNSGLPDQQSSEAFIDVLTSLAAQANAGASNVLGASMAMPGPFDYEQGVSWMQHKMPYLYGVNLRQALAERFGWEPCQVRFLNDAAASMWGEVGAGAARGVSRAVGLMLGTGIGSAFAVDGHIENGGPGVPPGGEIWNLPFEGGIVEDLISTRTVKQHYKEKSGEEREVAEIAMLASTNLVAAEVFAEFGRNLGRVLRSLLQTFAPDVVVLGGGISRSAELFLPATRNELQGFPLDLRISTLGDHAPLVGAGVSWFAGSCAGAHR